MIMHGEEIEIVKISIELEILYGVETFRKWIPDIPEWIREEDT